MVLKILLVILLLSGCNFALEDEGTLQRKTATVRISYSGLQFHDIDLNHDRKSRAITSQEELLPVYHYIWVEPDVDFLMLDNSMTVEVLVPVDTPLWIIYMNWTEEQPNHYYKHGISDEFIVTHDSPEKISIWIDTKINPDYPFDDEDIMEDEEEEPEEEEPELEEEEEEEIDETLLVHYKFEDDLKDSSSYGRDLTLCTGSNQFTFLESAQQGMMVDGKAAWFEGEECAENEFRDTNGASPIGMSDDFTISFWILPLISSIDFDMYHSVMSTGDSTSGYRFQIDHSGDEELRFSGYMKIDIEEEWMFFTYTKSTGTIATNDNKKVRVYKNAVLMSYAYPLTTLFDKLKIGMNRLGGGGWYGFIDDFRIYDRALTEDEIEELYESYDY